MELTADKNASQLEVVTIENERFYKITDSDSLRSFFMSIVSPSNHWMFISSNGGLTAGRKNSDNALFPYYTDDKIAESFEITGSKTILRGQIENQSFIWEPFSDKKGSSHRVVRNLYKNVYSNKILFEEINLDLNLSFQYQWNSSDSFGFVKKSTVSNNSQKKVTIEVLDGIQNIMPYGVASSFQNQSSNLIDAYKRNELLKESGVGIYALSAIIVDKAEPSEALKANVVWSVGLENPSYLVSSLQLSKFRRGIPIQQETDIKAEKGAYFVTKSIALAPDENKEWMIIADVNKDHSAVIALSEKIKQNTQLEQELKEDVELGTTQLIELNAASDGLQLTADHYKDTRHFCNVLFNIMRGGIFDNNYQIEKSDFKNYLSKANTNVSADFEKNCSELPDLFSVSTLKKQAESSDDLDFKRLSLEYLPLKFSRRHGDPSRPWNKFSINTRSEIDGSKILDYEGNWRDIFQNWEALAYSYPDFIESMIHKFLNATTFDGYNPYRVTRDGFDWETIEPDDPWSYIGYWGDHQIIYLLKFLEFIQNYEPSRLNEYFNEDLFVYANVPYRIKSYKAILKNPKDTIDFDHQLDDEIRTRREKQGADGALLKINKQATYHVNFIEKILATVLAKLSNFIPEGGIWMNTQRPEWNDANNALVGNGVSMVTLCYLRRFLTFFKLQFEKTDLETVLISSELADLFEKVFETFQQYENLLSNEISDTDRKLIVDGLGKAGSEFRLLIYREGFKGQKRKLSVDKLRKFTELSLAYADHTIQTNKRTDKLYHAYNLMTVESDDSISLNYLSEMLEGQVAVLSSGYLSAIEVVDVLDALKSSALFREDQYSYLLYPNKDLPRFIEKNSVSNEAVNRSILLTQLLKDGNTQIIQQDIKGGYHFSGTFKNAADLQDALNELRTTEYKQLVEENENVVLEIFEDIFNHKAFTGRSGTFYGYEGLGSIYWHMVSKLQLAVQECCVKAVKDGESDEIIGRLLEHYYEINEGIGVHKSPSLYGAFPTDPYSHTPAGKGAQQPGMTGQVKEDILCRFGELGVFIKDGVLSFEPSLLRRDEFIAETKSFEYINVQQEKKQLQLEKNSLCFTYCQIPVIYQIASDSSVEVYHLNEETTIHYSLQLDKDCSQRVFKRTGEVTKIIVKIKANQLR